MLSCFKKFYLVFLSLYAILTCAMDNKLKVRSASWPSLDKQIIANTKLFKAIVIAQRTNYSQEEDWIQIKKCIKQGANPNYRMGKDGLTVIMLAVSYSKKNICKYLLRCGADINICSNDGLSPLSISLHRLRKNSNNFTLQILNSETDDVKIFKKLLKWGADSNISFLCAVEYGNKDLMKISIEYGADVNQQNINGYTPLALAIMRNKFTIIRPLCSVGASVGLRDLTMFHSQDEQFKQRVIETLLILKKYNICKDLQYLILAKFPENHLPSHVNINLLLADGFKYFCIFNQLKSRIEWTKQMLRNSDDRSKKALKRVCKVEPLFNETQLEGDYYTFNTEFPDILNVEPNNLICQLYTTLLDRQRSK